MAEDDEKLWQEILEVVQESPQRHWFITATVCGDGRSFKVIEKRSKVGREHDEFSEAEIASALPENECRLCLCSANKPEPEGRLGDGEEEQWNGWRTIAIVWVPSSAPKAQREITVANQKRFVAAVTGLWVCATITATDHSEISSEKIIKHC